MADLSKYLLVHSADPHIEVPPPVVTLVTTPYDDVRMGLLEYALAFEKNLLDGDGKLSEADRIIKETWDTMKEVRCRSILEWSHAIAEAKSLGHELTACDDPRCLHLGFVDDTTNVVYSLPLFALKEASPEDWEASGVDRESFRTVAGRYRMLGNSIFNHGACYDASEEDKAHRQGLVDEICADINREFDREIPVLDLLIPRPPRLTVAD